MRSGRIQPPARGGAVGHAARVLWPRISNSNCREFALNFLPRQISQFPPNSKFPPNFERLVLRCIGKLLTRSTRSTCFCIAQTSIFQQKFIDILQIKNRAGNVSFALANLVIFLLNFDDMLSELAGTLEFETATMLLEISKFTEKIHLEIWELHLEIWNSKSNSGNLELDKLKI